MRSLFAFFGILAAFAMAGCGDDPVSAPAQEGTSEPAGKLIVSATTAGSYRGTIALTRLTRAVGSAINRHNVPQLMTYWAEDVVYEFLPLPAPMVGKAAVTAFFTDLFHGWPDFRTTSEHMLVSGNIVVTEHSTMATHLGDWMGIPATGKSGTDVHMDIWEYQGDQLAKVTTYHDVVNLLITIGVMPASPVPSLVPSFTLPAPVAPGLAPLQAGVETTRRWDTHDMADYARMLHQSAVIKYNTMGMIPLDRNAFVALSELYILGFPDVHTDIVRSTEFKDGWVLNEVVWRGTNTGPYFGIPATGKSVSLRGALLVQFSQDGLLTKMNIYFDNMSMLTQLGLVPAQ